jgi:DNA mismatch repair protein MutS
VARSKKKESAETPLMRQYNSFKAKHPDAILLFRVGDFYETFSSDAEKAAKILGIVLTKRKNGKASEVALAGFPHHALDTYLTKLVRAGERVAICEQLEDPNASKKIVRRGITELVTPGLTTHENTYEQKQNNYLAAIHIDRDETGLALLDITTGSFQVAQGAVDSIDKLIQNFSPKEILVERSQKARFEKLFGSNHYCYLLDEWVFSEEYAHESLNAHFQTKSLKGFGVEDLKKSIIAAGACMWYLKQAEHHNLGHIQKISRIDDGNFVWLDHFTVRNLEVFHSNQEDGTALVDILDDCSTPMGSRHLRRWLSFPLKSLPEIRNRHEIVDAFISLRDTSHDLGTKLSQIGDLERLISRVALQRTNPRELNQLKKSLISVQTIKELYKKNAKKALKRKISGLANHQNVIHRLETVLDPEAPIQLGKGNTIKEGVDDKLDELRNLRSDSKSVLEEILERDRTSSGISSLKLGFNNVFGYYYEVRNTYKNEVPEDWIRKQTLVSAERYITEELKEYESRILNAEDHISQIERRIYQELLDSLLPYVAEIQSSAFILAELDILLSFSRTAEKHQYCKPILDDSNSLEIIEGRHPVIEQNLGYEEQYIPNDIYLDQETHQIMMITGPNMSGKSAILRQTALIALLAQIGSFVPARQASIGWVDKIFTRVGASDNISMGESTFMVEMNETASILNNISKRSLILLDEIGRGTSTYDGVSIAWSIADYLHNSIHRPKTLFATHYHELNEMEKAYERIKNFNVSIKQAGSKIIFLRKLAKGGSNHSFGIHVAMLAGMPKTAVKKAEEILNRLEESRSEEKIELAQPNDDQVQLSFFQLDDPTLGEVKKVILDTDINTLTPVEALMKLNDIKKKLGE